MKASAPFGDWNVDPDEVELAGFERIPHSADDWQSMTQRMNQSAIRNLMIAGDREAVWFGQRESLS